MKSILLAAMNGVLILFTVLVHKIIFRILGLGYDNLVIYWGLFVLIFFIFDVILNFFFLKDKGIEYSYAAEPPVQFRLSHLSRRSEPL